MNNKYDVDIDFDKEITIDEFDKMDKPHTFSDTYNMRKKKMLKDYRKKYHTAGKTAGVVAAAAMLLVVTPVAVNAATDGELFRRIWGTGGKENIEEHEVPFEKDGDIHYADAPSQEFVDTDYEKAEQLIGDNITAEPKVVNLGENTTMTINSVVSDGSSAVIDYTLENPDGVPLIYSEETNEFKGASISDDADFHYNYGWGDKMYVDIEQSTETKVHIYDYVSDLSYFDENGNTLKDENSIPLQIFSFPDGMTRTEYNNLYDELCGDIEINSEEDIPDELKELTDRCKDERIMIPAEPVKMLDFKSEEGNTLKISPISMLFGSNSHGFDSDPGSVFNITIKFKDGESYMVWNRKEEDVAGLDGYKYTVDAEDWDPDIYVENSFYACGRLDGSLSILFNRLVDTENIDCIMINGEKYTLQQ